MQALHYGTKTGAWHAQDAEEDRTAPPAGQATSKAAEKEARLAADEARRPDLEEPPLLEVAQTEKKIAKALSAPASSSTADVSRGEDDDEARMKEDESRRPGVDAGKEAERGGPGEAKGRRGGRPGPEAPLQG